ncbi:IS607 family element RNA-guided endonuclease TnpB [Glycomyces salinus]|uniref:IS607 family element RNA-guided endonuclease TnpB n=1 Tax=Glycomyces salinus TaxID=980294 RepID=UPI0018ECE2A3|nr:IS607 family element RNA-guided endonuclease TnpB [Glycomyces salinus]
MLQAYRFALDPNSGQESALRSHCGGARVAYNWAVSWVMAAWSQRAAEATYGIADEELTEWRPWSLPALRRAFNAAKRTDPRLAGWWAENSKEAYNTGLTAAATAFDNFAKSKRGDREGPKMGVPRRKRKGRAQLSCRFWTGTIRVEPDRRHVTLPRLGTIRVHEKTSKLERRIANGTARILSATVRFERGRWFVAFQVEVERAKTTPRHPNTAVGVDLGVTHLAVTADSDGNTEFIANPQHYEAALQKLRRASRLVSRRQGPDKRTGQQPSRRWLRANAERNRIHHRVANLRADALHKTTTNLAAEYGTVAVEDLNVAGMLRNRRLARKIADAGFGEIRRQLTYKTDWRGGQLVVADRWFPSSKTCSGCGAVKAKLPLHIRVFKCEACGLVKDRDENAALNLAALAAVCSTGTGVAGDQGTKVPNPRRADNQTRATTGITAGGRAVGATPVPRDRNEDRKHAYTQPTLW